MKLDHIDINTENQASKSEKLALKFYREIIIPTSEQAFEELHGIPANIVFLRKKDDTLEQMTMDANEFMHPGIGKDLLAALIRKVIKEEKGIVGFIMSHEAWAVEMQASEYKENSHIKPSEDPRKKEVFMISLETENISKCTTWGIDRSQGDPKLIDKYEMDNPSMAGKFAGFLKDAKKREAN